MVSNGDGSNNSIRSAYRKICNYKQCLKKKKGGKIMKLKRKCSIVLGFVVVVFVCAFFSLDGFYLLASHNPFHWLSPKNSLYLQKFLLSPSSAVSKFNLFHFEFFYLSTKQKQKTKQQRNKTQRKKIQMDRENKPIEDKMCTYIGKEKI